MVKVSVVIPVYNQKRFLCGAVGSALAQDAEKELIIIDDASPDGAGVFLFERLLAKFPVRIQKDTAEEKRLSVTAYGMTTEVSIVLLPQNGGVSAARNLGTKLAAGEYVAFLDADDRFRKGKLAAQLARMEGSDAAFCCTGRRMLSYDGKPTGHEIGTPERITEQTLHHGNCVNCSSVLIRRELMLAYPMEHDEVHEDYLTWLRILSDHPYAAGIDEPLIDYRSSARGKSGSKVKSLGMNLKTFRVAGYGRIKSFIMLCGYIVGGIKKYMPKKH